MPDTNYWQKPLEIIDESILWNIPEQKTGRIAILGGNSNSFVTEIRNAEFLNTLPLKSARLLLPDSLKTKIPTIDTIDYADSTDSGSFAKSTVLETFALNSDLIFLSGDLSKNSITEVVITELLRKLPKNQLLLISRDAVDLICSDIQYTLERDNTIILASMLQLQKIFRTVYYPKMLLLSMPLFPVVEILHKFTLSFPVLLLTFHQNQIILAHHGNIYTIPLDHTNYTPLSLWSGTLACKISVLSLWNPQNLLNSAETAIFWDTRRL